MRFIKAARTGLRIGRSPKLQGGMPLFRLRIRPRPFGDCRRSRPDHVAWVGGGGEERGADGPPHLMPYAGAGGRRMTGGGSVGGGLEELVELVLSRRS